MPRKNEKWFGKAAFVVSYEAGPSEEYNRTLVLEFVPGKVMRFFGLSSYNRIFVGGVEKPWFRLRENKPMVRCSEWEQRWLASICDRCEARRRLLRRLERRKAGK